MRCDRSPLASRATQWHESQVAALAFLCLLAALAMHSNGQTEPSTLLGSVQGHIICSDGGFPAANAHVTLVSVASLLGQKVSVGSLNSSTDFNGNYIFRDIPPGDYVLSVRQAGYVDDTGNLWQNFRRYNTEKQKELLAGAPLLTVRDGSARFDLVIRRGGAISGRVTFDNGSPVTSASVLVNRVLKATQSVAEGDASDLWNLRATTDDRGRFRIAGLPKGNYQISVSAHSSTGGSFTVFAPNTFKASGAKQFAIDEGDECDDADVTVPLNSLHSIGGVITRGGAPLPSAQLTIQQEGEKRNEEIGVNSDGTYRVGLLSPGTYVIQANYSSLYGVPVTRSILVNVLDTDVLDANLELLSDTPTR